MPGVVGSLAVHQSMFWGCCSWGPSFFWWTCDRDCASDQIVSSATEFIRSVVDGAVDSLWQSLFGSFFGQSVVPLPLGRGTRFGEGRLSRFTWNCTTHAGRMKSCGCGGDEIPTLPKLFSWSKVDDGVAHALVLAEKRECRLNQFCPASAGHCCAGMAQAKPSTIKKGTAPDAWKGVNVLGDIELKKGAECRLVLGFGAEAEIIRQGGWRDEVRGNLWWCPEETLDKLPTGCLHYTWPRHGARAGSGGTLVSLKNGSNSAFAAFVVAAKSAGMTYIPEIKMWHLPSGVTCPAVGELKGRNGYNSNRGRYYFKVLTELRHKVLSKGAS